MDGQVEAQFDDPPVFGVPQEIGTGASQKRVQCVDGGLPEVEPVPPGPKGEGDLEAYRLRLTLGQAASTYEGIQIIL